MKKITQTLNLWTSQFFKCMQFLYLIMLIAVLMQGEIYLIGDSLSGILLFTTGMVFVSTFCGVLYMHFYNKYMNSKPQEEMQTGNFPEPDDVGYE